MHLSPVPSPVVMVSPVLSVLVSGSSLSLICSIQPTIQPTSVTTATTVIFSWNAPNNIYDTVDSVTDTSVELIVSSVVTADSGDYICSATITDSSDSTYIIDSEPANDTASVIVSK